MLTPFTRAKPMREEPFSIPKKLASPTPHFDRIKRPLRGRSNNSGPERRCNEEIVMDYNY
jgi:hypothetical protein